MPSMQLISKWFKIPQFIRFIIVGVFNTALAYLVFCLLVFIFGEEFRQICLAAQWALTSFITFLTQRTFVFRSKDKLLKEYSKCCVSWALGYLINAILLELIMKLPINVYLAQIIALGLTSICNFVLLKYWALRKKKGINNENI